LSPQLIEQQFRSFGFILPVLGFLPPTRLPLQSNAR
jgi:hypothetical protein